MSCYNPISNLNHILYFELVHKDSIYLILMKKLLLSASILLSSLILQAQTQIDFRTFVNNCPTLSNATNYSNSYIENSTNVAVVNTNFSISDLDLATASSTQAWTTTIRLTNGVSLDSLYVPASSNGFTVSSPVYAYPNLTVSITGTGTAANLANLIKAITFKSVSENPSITARSITIEINDGTCSGNGNSTISITRVNDNPVLDLDNNDNSGKIGADYQTTYTEKGSDKNIADTDITITDVDNTTLSSTTIILTNKQVGDTIKVGTLLGGITSSVVSSAGTISITLTGSTTIANYQSAIRNIVYSNSSSNPSATDRYITVQVNDGQATSNVATTTIHIMAVNDCPIVDLNTTTVGNNDVATYTENASAINIISSNISISDPDKTTQTWNVKVELTNTFALDSLLKPANIGGLIISNPDYMSIPGRISITISGSGTGNQLATAINGIKFKTASENPNITPRNINIEISDDAIPACKVTAVSTININAKNDCPIVDLNTNSLGNDYLTVFVEQGVKVNVTSSNISITDVDNTIQKWNSTVELSNAVSLDSLFSSVTVSGFTVSPVSYTSGKVTVNITGTGTGVQLSSIIKGITYKSSSLNPDVTTRNIVVSISDDSSCTTSANSLITINLVVIDNDTITFQDFAFKSALISLGIDKNADNKIQKKEVVALKKLNINNKLIQNLAGIEWFKALDSLNVSFNNLTNINLSALVNLTYLNASNNKLSDVSITNFANQRVSTIAPNTKLQTLLVNNNQLTKLDVSNLLALKVLDARVNTALFQVCVNPSHDLTNFKVDLTTTLTSTCGILTSIENELNHEPKTLVGIYNLIGQKIENEQATNGIYIFVYSDGSREKVLR